MICTGSIEKSCFTGSRARFPASELSEPKCYERVSPWMANLVPIETRELLPVPATAITEPVWLAEQLDAAARRYRLDRRATVGVLWWYSASTVLLGPPVESLIATGVAADPDLSSVTLYLHADGRLLHATSDAVLGNDPGKLGRRIEETLSTSIDAVAAASGAPPRALWAIATDSLANRVLWAGGTPAVAHRLARAIGPLLPPPRYVEVGGQTIVRRASCCLVYEVAGCEKCTSCPRQPPDERLRRVSRGW